MQDLLAHPATQAAIAPFVVALTVALLFRRKELIVYGLAIMGAFLTTVLLTSGLALQPLTSTRKIILLSLCLPLLLLLLEFLLGKASGMSERRRRLIVLVVPAVLLVVAVSWVIWPVFLRQDVSEAWLMLARVSGYVTAVGVVFFGVVLLKTPEKTTAQGASAFALGLGTAVTSMIAASALYAQLAFSIVAAVACLQLLSLFKTSFLPEAKQGVGYLGPFGLFAAVAPLAIIAAAATVYAQLSGWVLLCLAMVPLFAVLPAEKIARPWLRLMTTNMLCLLPVIPAIWLAWDASESISY